MSWPVEDIPNAHRLFMRVHRGHIGKDGTPGKIAFQNHGDHMSTNWAKYRSAQETREEGGQPASNYGVVAMNVGMVREVPDQEVIHDPISLENRAHTGVVGEKTTEVRVKLRRLACWEIPLESED